MTTVALMRGLPGSGKSTQVQQLCCPGTDLIVSADQYFDRLARQVGKTYQEVFDPRFLGAAHAWCLKTFAEALRSEEYSWVFVDNTNTTLVECAPYIALAQAYGATLKVYELECDPEVAFQRNVHGVPKAAYARMQENLQTSAAQWPRHWPEIIRI